MHQRHTMTDEIRALVKCAVAQCFTFGPDRRQMTPALVRASYEASGNVPQEVWDRLKAARAVEWRNGWKLTSAGERRLIQQTGIVLKGGS